MRFSTKHLHVLALFGLGLTTSYVANAAAASSSLGVLAFVDALLAAGGLLLMVVPILVSLERTRKLLLRARFDGQLGSPGGQT